VCALLSVVRSASQARSVRSSPRRVMCSTKTAMHFAGDPTLPRGGAVTPLYAQTVSPTDQPSDRPKCLKRRDFRIRRSCYPMHICIDCKRVAAGATTDGPSCAEVGGGRWRAHCAAPTIALQGPAAKRTSPPTPSAPIYRDYFGRIDMGICMFCGGCGWCEGSPAFTCPECKGTGEETPKAKPKRIANKTKGAR
jgi:hypothetical protein